MIDRFPTSRIRIPGGLGLHLLDTHYFKSLIFARLAEDARQPISFHRKAEMSFASQITAEVLIRDRNGKMIWQRKRKNNHYLDCTMLAAACTDGSWLPSLQMLVEREANAQAQHTPARLITESQPSQGSRIHMPPRPELQRILPARGLSQHTVNRPGFIRRGSDF